MYDIRVEDFIDVKSNKSPFDLNDLIHICKRVNNCKREYLFVNKYQGKHIPVSPYYITSLFDSFVAEVKANIKPSEKVIVVGFAETATGIAEYLTYKLSLDKEYKNTVVHHLQTSRENYSDCPKLFTFDEEHSHAVNQYLYSKNFLPKYDKVLFVEDEITTGNTILNFINEFKKINPDCNYAVSSILNWQNGCNRKTFDAQGIDRICLVEGEIKADLPTLSMVENKGAVDYINHFYKGINATPFIYASIVPNSRKGVDPHSFRRYVDKVQDKVTVGLCSYIDRDETVMVIGTEEFMFYPMMAARDLEQSLGCKVKYRATTRSPIVSCSEDGYIIKDAITLPSAYDKDRQTYLYNMNDDYSKIVVISDVNMTLEFKQAITEFAVKNSKKVYFITV